MENIESKIDNQNEKINPQKLTPEQQKSFENFLKESGYKDTLNLSDKETQAHLTEFKKELEVQNNNEKIDSSGKLLSGSNFEKNFGNKENFEKFTKTIDLGVYEYFFGVKGILKNLQISESEKKSFVASSGVYLMNNFYDEVAKAGNLGAVTAEIKKFLGGSEEKGDLAKLGENLTSGNGVSESVSIIKDVFSGNLTKIFAKVYKEEKMNLVSESFSGVNLKNNQIFSNPNETFNFFDNVLKNNSSKEDLKKFIEGKNSDLPVNPPKDLKNFKEIGNKLGNFITPEIGNTLGNASNIFDIFTKGKESIKNTILGNEKLVETFQVLASMPVIGGILKALFGFLGVNLDAPYDNPEKNLEKISEKIIAKDSFLEGLKLTENFGKEDNKIDENFINNLKFISKTENHKDFSSNLEKLFKKSGDFHNFINIPELKILPGFEEKSQLKNEKGEIIYENLKYLTEFYKEFLTEKENKKISSPADFANQKNSANKQTENEVYGTEAQNLEQSVANSLRQSTTPDSGNNGQNPIILNGNQNTASETRGEQSQTAILAGAGGVLAGSTTQPSGTPIILNEKSNPAQNNPQVPTNNPAPTKPEPKAPANNPTPTKPEPKVPANNPSEKKPEQNNFVINKNENIEFSGNKISFVFDVSGKKYEASLFGNDKGHLTITGNGEKVIFNGGKEFFTTLNKFNGKLDKEAEASDFGKNVGTINPKLGTTIKNILINGFEDKPGLKQILSQNFLNSGSLVKNNVSVNFSDKNYTLNFEKAEGQKLA